MPDKYNQTQRIQKVKGDAHYHFHEAAPAPPPVVAPAGRRSVRWGWVGGVAAALALGGTLVATQLNARPVYYCASHTSGVKYHPDATCQWLQQCGARVKSLPLGKARARMDACKACH